MDDRLQQIIAKSSYERLPGRYYYVKVRSRPSGKHFMVSQEADGTITIVTTDINSLGADIIGQNQTPFTLFGLNLWVQFNAVGFLAVVCTALAAEDINILTISTYQKDYMLFDESRADDAQRVFEKLGFRRV